MISKKSKKHSTHGVCVDLENLTGADMMFIQDFLALFADPHFAKQLQQLRQGEIAIQYGPLGKLIVVPKN